MGAISNIFSRICTDNLTDTEPPPPALAMTQQHALAMDAADGVIDGRIGGQPIAQAGYGAPAYGAPMYGAPMAALRSSCVRIRRWTCCVRRTPRTLQVQE